MGVKPPPPRLALGNAAVFVCDIQEKFRPVIHKFEHVVHTAGTLLKAASLLGMPVVVTEQYPKGLGHTVPELLPLLPEGTVKVEKIDFTMVVPDVTSALDGFKDVTNILIVGAETHVCVLQTALDLIERGYHVHIIVDGVSSQRQTDRAVALHRLGILGATLSTSETALFEMMKSTRVPQFKEVSKLVREPRPEQQLDF